MDKATLRAIIESSRRKWTVGSGARADDPCAFCDWHREHVPIGACRRWCDECARTYWPDGCLGALLRRYGLIAGRINSDSPLWADACELMHRQFDRIGKEFLT